VAGKTDDPEKLRPEPKPTPRKVRCNVRALQEALDLEEETRFKLWFLRAERVMP